MGLIEGWRGHKTEATGEYFAPGECCRPVRWF